MDVQRLLEQVSRCHRLAEACTDRQFREKLLKLEQEYQRQVDELANDIGIEFEQNFLTIASLPTVCTLRP